MSGGRLALPLGLVLQLVLLAGDDAVADLGDVGPEVAVVGAGYHKRLAVLPAIHGQQEVDIVAGGLISRLL